MGGENVRVALVVEAARMDEALATSAEIVGAEDVIDAISCGALQFDRLITTEVMIPKVALLGKLLGPKGLLPCSAAGTLTSDVSSAVSEFKAGKIDLRTDKAGVSHHRIGTVCFPSSELLENLVCLVRAIEFRRPPGANEDLWQSLHICSSMGPSFRI